MAGAFWVLRGTISGRFHTSTSTIEAKSAGRSCAYWTRASGLKCSPRTGLVRAGMAGSSLDARCLVASYESQGEPYRGCGRFASHPPRVPKVSFLLDLNRHG